MSARADPRATAASRVPLARRGRAAHLVVLLSAAVVSGLLYAGSFSPVGPRALAWIALVPLFLAARTVGPGGAFLVGVLWNQVSLFVLIDALPSSVEQYFGQPAWVAWPFSAAVYFINAGLYYGAALALYRALSRRYSIALPALAAAAWVGAELARTRLFNATEILLGTPLAMAGHSQAGQEALMQLASVTGYYGISFLVVAINASLAELVRSLRRSPRSPIAALASLAVSAGLVLAALAYGHFALRAEPPDEADGALVRVAVVQGNLDLGARWQPEFYTRNLHEYLELTMEAVRTAGAEKPDVVFWPEGALTFSLAEEPLLRKAMARVLSGLDVELVAGGSRNREDDPSRWYNTIFLISPTGEIRGHYDKQYLLPFAEFAPISRLDMLRREFGPTRYVERGAPTPPLPTRAGPAGVIVCNEVMFPELAARRVREGAAYLIAPSNDGWMGGSWHAWPKWGRLMLEAAAFRAVEQGRYLVRASTSGPSAIIDPRGRVRASTEPGATAILLGGIRERTGLTIYARIGDLFAALCAAAALAALVGSRLFSNATRR